MKKHHSLKKAIDQLTPSRASYTKHVCKIIYRKTLPLATTQRKNIIYTSINRPLKLYSIPCLLPVMNFTVNKTECVVQNVIRLVPASNRVNCHTAPLHSKLN